MKKVLFTRKLNVIEILWSFLNGIIPVSKSMIRIKPLKISKANKRQIFANQHNYYVFTSKNAVKYFLRFYFFNKRKLNLQNVEFIAIGSKTAKRLRRFTNKVHVFQYGDKQSFYNYVTQITNGAKYIYFCSDLAAVKWNLQTNNSNALIVENYQTIASAKKVKTNKFKHLVFMSSSAVNSFFQKNIKIPESVVCYTIGEPTRITLSNYYSGKIFKPKTLSFNAILKLVKSKT